MTEDRRQAILKKIQLLLDRASNTPFEAEADAARAKADELMTIYTIESAELEMLKPRHEREQVTTRFVDICEGKHVGKEGLMNLISAVAVHCRCKILHYNYEGTRWPYKAKLFGFPSDLDYAEALFTNLLLQLSKDMKPTYDQNASYEANLVRFKESGMKWQEMHPLLTPYSPKDPGAEWTRNIGVRYTKIYTDYCKAHNRERMYTSPQKFVRSFIYGFATRVNGRLYEIRRRRKEIEDERGPGTDIVLRDRYQEVADAYNDHAKGKSIKEKKRDLDSTAFYSGREAADRADLGQPRMGSRKAING